MPWLVRVYNGFNTVSPITSKRLIDIYVLPRLTYGLETSVVEFGHFQPSNLFHTKRTNLRRFSNLLNMGIKEDM